MRKLSTYAALLLLSLSIFVHAEANKPQPSGTVTKELAETYFQRMFGYEPDLSIKVLKVEPSSMPGLIEITVVFNTPQGQQANKWYVTPDMKHVIVGEVLPFGADPFAADRAKLASSVTGPAKGPADAKLLIVEFGDLECPACQKGAPIVDKLRGDFPQARFVFENFPLTQHPWAQKAAGYLDCIGRANPDQAFSFIDSVYSHQKEIEDAVRKTGADGKTAVDDAAVTEQLRKYTSEAGADPDKIAACAATSETTERILRSEELGKEVGVTSTPTLYVNGRRLANFVNAPYEALTAVVSFEAERAGK